VIQQLVVHTKLESCHAFLWKPQKVKKIWQRVVNKIPPKIDRELVYCTLNTTRNNLQLSQFPCTTKVNNLKLK
jgi:hypothetical protein